MADTSVVPTEWVTEMSQWSTSGGIGAPVAAMPSERMKATSLSHVTIGAVGLGGASESEARVIATGSLKAERDCWRVIAWTEIVHFSPGVPSRLYDVPMASRYTSGLFAFAIRIR